VDKGSFEGDASLNDISVHDPARKAAQNQVYIIVPLQRIHTDQIVIVVATHLKAKKGHMNERIRLLQASELKSRVNRMADTLQSNGWRNRTHVIIMGDFNSEPSDASVQCILDPNGSDSLWTMQSAYNLQDPICILLGKHVKMDPSAEQSTTSFIQTYSIKIPEMTTTVFLL
jgi:muramoyltetrapeptide carboxypeptidase LdcA involved in peptidoglycan recycling